MTYKYNKELAVHIGLTIIAYILLIQLWGWGRATLVILVFCGISTVMFNCYRIDLTKDEMTIFQIYGGKTSIPWDDIELVEIGKYMVEMPIIGSVKNMTVKFHDKNELIINIEPVVRDEMIEEIQRFCRMEKI